MLVRNVSTMVCLRCDSIDLTRTEGYGHRCCPDFAHIYDQLSHLDSVGRNGDEAFDQVIALTRSSPNNVLTKSIGR